MLAHLLGLPPRALPADSDVVDGAILQTWLSRRAAREPLAFITGRAGFWTFDVSVSPATLIPRADSETLIEAALAAFPDRANVGRVVDLGTGTGCLLLACLLEFPSAFGLGVDLVPEAARLAACNAADLGLANRASFVVADWSAPISASFDLVLCNPPYIRVGDIPCLMPEVGTYEPATALNGGADGLAAYRALLPGLCGLVAQGGCAILELGQGQAEDVARLAGQAGFRRTSTRADMAGIERAIILHPSL